MTAALGEAAGGFDLTSLFVSVVPSFSGMADAMKEAGGAGAEGFQEGFKDSFHPFENASSVISESTNMFAKVGGEAAEAFAGAFSSLMKGQMPDLVSGFNVAEDAVKEFVGNTVGEIPLIGGIFEKTFGGIMDTIDAFKGPAGEFIDTLMQMGEGWQETARTIAGQTLDTGKIPELMDIVKQLGAEGVPNLEVVSKSIGQISTRLGELNPEQLKEFMKTYAGFSELLGTAPSAETLTGVMNAFKVPTEDANKALTELGNTAIAAGIPINELLMQMGRGDVGLAAFGFNIQQAGTMLASMNKEGIQGGRMLAAFQTAGAKFAKEGLTPKEGFKDLVDTIKNDIAKGTDAGGTEALLLLKKYFGAANAEKIFEGIKQHLIDLPDLIKPLEDLDQGPEKALSATETLEDKLKSLKAVLDSALEPLTKGMADKLTEVGTRVSTWIQTHQGEILGAVKTVLDQIVSWTSTSLDIMGHAVLGVAPYLNVIKSIMVDIGKIMVDMLETLTTVGAAVHLPGMADAKRSVDEMHGALDRLGNLDITKFSTQFGNDMLWARGQVNKAGEGLDGLLNPMIAAGNISDAFKMNITDAKTGVEGVKDMFEKTAEGGLKILGDDNQYEMITAKLRKLGIDVTTGPDGVVTKITAGNQLIGKQFGDWYKQATGKDLTVKVEVKPHEKQTLDDLMTGAGVPDANKGPEGVKLPFTLFMDPNQASGGLGTLVPGGLGSLEVGGGGSTGLPGSPGTGFQAGGEVKGAVQKAMIDSGFSAADWPAIDYIISHESSWDPTSQNNYDINAKQGNPSRGLGQLTLSNYRAAGVDPHTNDPYLQGMAMMSYIKGRYGSPSAAYAHWVANHNYAGGGPNMGKFSTMGQPVPGEWQPGRDTVHGVLEVGEYVVRRDKAQKHKKLLDAVNFGGMGFVTGGNVPFPNDGSPGSPDYGVSPEILQVEQIARNFNLPLTSGYRDPGGPAVAGVSAAKSYHGRGMAGDFSDGDKTENELRFAAYMYQNYGRGIAELIHDDPRWTHNINDGRDVGPMGQFYTTAQAGYHGDHVHIAIKHAGSGTGGPDDLGSPGGSGFPGGFSPMGLGSPGGGGLFGGGGIGGPTPAQQRELARIDERIAKIKAKLDTAEADYNRYAQMAPEEQALNRNEMEKAKDKRDKLQGEYDDALQSRNDKQLSINEHLAKEGGKEKTLFGKTTDESAGSRIGEGLVKGVFQELGFPDVFGKPFTEWGIWKLAMGGLGFGAGLLEQAMGGGQGGGQGGKSGGGGGLLAGAGGGLIKALTGMDSKGIASVMAPSQAPENVPLGANPAAFGGLSIVNNNNGIMHPNDVQSTIQRGIVDGSRQVATSGGAPVVQPH
jgi:hypothetical protein